MHDPRLDSEKLRLVVTYIQRVYIYIYMNIEIIYLEWVTLFRLKHQFAFFR